jgi:hypothetical protein
VDRIHPHGFGDHEEPNVRWFGSELHHVQELGVQIRPQVALEFAHGGPVFQKHEGVASFDRSEQTTAPATWLDPNCWEERLESLEDASSPDTRRHDSNLASDHGH